MNDTPEGKAALEAAGRAVMAAKTLDTPDGEADPRYVAEAAIRAYLQALPGWQLAPRAFVTYLRDDAGRPVSAPPPPGLEPASHD